MSLFPVSFGNIINISRHFTTISSLSVAKVPTEHWRNRLLYHKALRDNSVTVISWCVARLPQKAYSFCRQAVSHTWQVFRWQCNNRFWLGCEGASSIILLYWLLLQLVICCGNGWRVVYEATTRMLSVSACNLMTNILQQWPLQLQSSTFFNSSQHRYLARSEEDKLSAEESRRLA